MRGTGRREEVHHGAIFWGAGNTPTGSNWVRTMELNLADVPIIAPHKATGDVESIRLLDLESTFSS